MPSIRTVLEWVVAQGCPLRLHPDSGQVDLDSADWREVAFQYQEGKEPILTDISSDDGTPDCLFREEVGEFQEFVGEADDTPGKQRVLEHLQASRFVVANQLLADVEQDGYQASAWLLDYFVEHAGGMIEADGEGFYDGDTLLVELD